MERVILDTAVLVHIERGDLPVEDLLGDSDDAVIAAVTAAELLVGVHLADDQRRPARAETVESVLANLPVESYDLTVARRHAELLAALRGSGRPRGVHDLMIAATALARSRTVVTTDRTGFADLPGVSVRFA